MSEIAWEVHDGDVTLGPMSEDDVVRLLRAGRISPRAVVRPAGREKWKGVRAHAPFAVALESADTAEAPAEVPRPGGPIASLRARGRLVAALGIASFVAVMAGNCVANTFVFHVGASVRPVCNATGTGAISCSFTNEGLLPANYCVEIQLVRNEDGIPLTSEPICAGVVWPRETKSVELQAAFIGATPMMHCLGGVRARALASPWTDLCSMQVVPH